ncbi:mannan endo-1,4-beta-mannosidase [Maribacter vaceletii]|uniref:mannan endo-1,4-beta-mannosidase n=1 Tax=Maribacter vaceletii TaxID=1206816 RepID=A0A495EE42_9FLAO|nr:glycoside hydrolase family 2 TIM barrel-domain containing protein [Maribacter vaceletii]RKR14921.1 mannan endo-1,4-beta-mannosidase [Maribacter vaceletii]
MKKFFNVFLFFYAMTFSFSQDFVKVEGTNFKLKNKSYSFIGTNFWYGFNLGSLGEGGDRSRLIKELDSLQSIGVNNLRIMAASEGPDDAPWRMSPTLQKSPGVYNEELLDGLDFLIAEMGKRNMFAVVCLNNFWHWSGGMSQYVSWANNNRNIPYPPPQEGGDWGTYMKFTSQFYSDDKAIALFNNHVRFILNRENPYTNLRYNQDPTIMSWELGNEPYAMSIPEVYKEWINTTAKLIKGLAPSQLVTIGGEGNTNNSNFTNNNLLLDGNSDYIDYLTIHIWIQNWDWYNPQEPKETFSKALKKAKKYIKEHSKIAKKLNKPLVLEEFGIARDNNNYDPSASIIYRDLYYKKIFEIVLRSIKRGTPLKGANFWAWGGFGRPDVPKAFWKINDDFIGDPPHEAQGWYSVYDKDISTLQIIKLYNELIMFELEEK